MKKLFFSLIKKKFIKKNKRFKFYNEKNTKRLIITFTPLYGVNMIK